MDPNSLLSRLEALLDEERAAIVGLDAARVERAADEKQALLDALVRGAPLDAALQPRLGALRGALQHNLILLAHARDCVRDALAALRLGGLVPSGAGGASRPASRIHVTG
jgi:predicted nucleotidyltransferase